MGALEDKFSGKPPTGKTDDIENYKISKKDDGPDWT
jgi:hypothetical protein